MRWTSSILTVFAAVACASDGENAVTSPELIGRGTISTAAAEFAITFSGDGRTLFFNRVSTDRSRITMLTSQLVDEQWTTPSLTPFDGPFRDLDPFVSPDGTRLYFSSDRPIDEADSIPDFNTWFVEILSDGFGEPQALPEPLNTPATEVFASATRAGEIFFGSDRDGVLRIYRGQLVTPDAPVELVSVDLNLSESGSGNPLVAPDGQFLLFTAMHPDGMGGSDIYVTRRTADGWGPAAALSGGVNSRFADFAPALSPDGRMVYFTSERPGMVSEVPAGNRPPGDIYRISARTVGLP